MPSKGLPIALTAMLLAAAAMATGTFASSRTPLSSAPQQITIVDTATGQTSNGDTGTFTASGLTCPSGTFADTNTVGIKLVTKHTCGDASGAFDSFLRAVGPQTWRFAGGTSAYSTLRGHGQCQIAEGPPITRTCRFLAAFDDVAPTGTVSKFTVSRAPGKRAYAVHTSFTAHDDVAGNAVAFKLRLRVGSRTLATRSGTTIGEAKSFVLKVKAPKSGRQLTLMLTLTDPVGNTRTIKRTRRLPHRAL
jgi:hypothetical protein